MREPTRFLLFTGKGGVGKTTLAAATAVALAEEGRRVLLVSTDPASNLDDVLATVVGEGPTPVRGVAGLDAANIDPDAAAAEYRRKMIDPLRGRLGEAELRSVEEQLAGQCTVEVAAFDEFSSLLADAAEGSAYDHVVFDTAPTGHTLRLLALPAAWSSYIEENPGGASCLGPLASLGSKRDLYRAGVDALSDAARTTIVLVSRADPAALREAARAGAELSALGVANQRLVVNGVLTDPARGDRVAEGVARRERESLAGLPATLEGLPRSDVPMLGRDLTGLAAIALARQLAGRGCRTHLSTTDPAGDLPAALGPDVPPSLTVSRIDPAIEIRRHVERKLRGAAHLDLRQRAMLEEDMRSPCTEEIAVFQAFSAVLGRGRHEHVVIDTAPSGHTLLLLDRTGAYHREVMRRGAVVPSGRLTTPLMRMQDPDYTRVLLVTLAETTPVHEAAQLQDDLRRAHVEPFGWVINASLAASGTHNSAQRMRQSR